MRRDSRRRWKGFTISFAVNDVSALWMKRMSHSLFCFLSSQNARMDRSRVAWRHKLLALLAVLVASTAAAGEPETSKPDSHSLQTIEGWNVHIDTRLLEGDCQDIGTEAVRLLRSKLTEIEYAVPDDRLAKLREAPIWLDLSHGELRQMQYHPSADWLRENGYSTELAKAVHIPRATMFIDRKHNHTQPWAVLHELAHAYHDRVLGFDEPRILAAYERFRDREEFQSVLHVSGAKREHYGRTNQMEFFAELTESYFGTNDFYPFVRGELMETDPETHRLLEEVWGDKKS
jgi:hypothetical protein